ncbi:ADP-ribosylation factor [Acrasis kona]|uniref:ADP-ribosylation factor n=1 Tax=Acrasis kona TaxID=1008807 RepID=A0AAW2ZF50_9EUKA
MGGYISYMMSFFWKKNLQILFVGLDSAGRTTMLYYFKLGKAIDVYPTIGFNCEEIQFNNTTIKMFDVGGGDKIRPLWRHYYKDTNVIAFVVDSADHSRMSEAKQEIFNLLNDPLLDPNILFLIYANKQDRRDAKSTSEIFEALDLKSVINKKIHLQPCCAKNGEGLHEGIYWIFDHIN